MFLACQKVSYMLDWQLVHMSMVQKQKYWFQESNFILRIESYLLNFNKFTSWFFSNTQILIDHNDLVELAPYTFTNLANLSMVNLTYNKLTKFPLNALTLDTSKTLSSADSQLERMETNSKYRSSYLWQENSLVDYKVEPYFQKFQFIHFFILF